jgi:hypothetical protein
MNDRVDWKQIYRLRLGYCSRGRDRMNLRCAPPPRISSFRGAPICSHNRNRSQRTCIHHAPNVTTCQRWPWDSTSCNRCWERQRRTTVRNIGRNISRHRRCFFAHFHATAIPNTAFANAAAWAQDYVQFPHMSAFDYVLGWTA